MQYPTGLDAIALEVAVQMKATGRRGQSVSGATQVADEAGAQLSGRVAPEQNTQGKRRPGRPRKVQG